jgi:hypothetical protein
MHSQGIDYPLHILPAVPLKFSYKITYSICYGFDPMTKQKAAIKFSSANISILPK